MDYVLLAAWCFLVALGGGLVGLVLGNIRLPAVLLLLIVDWQLGPTFTDAALALRA